VSALKLVFFGSDPIAIPLLDWLAGIGRSTAGIVGVFTQPDRPMGRGQRITPNAIKQWASERGIPVYQPLKITEDVRAELAAMSPDLSLVMAYGHILKDDFIATPRLGTLNLHTSLLPKYRGASPIQTAIANGEKETGVTLMRIVRELDAGPIADVEKVAIAMDAIPPWTWRLNWRPGACRSLPVIYPSSPPERWPSPSRCILRQAFAASCSRTMEHSTFPGRPWNWLPGSTGCFPGRLVRLISKVSRSSSVRLTPWPELVSRGSLPGTMKPDC
jgi:hypothetical protein